MWEKIGEVTRSLLCDNIDEEPSKHDFSFDVKVDTTGQSLKLAFNKDGFGLLVLFSKC